MFWTITLVLALCHASRAGRPTNRSTCLRLLVFCLCCICAHVVPTGAATTNVHVAPSMTMMRSRSVLDTLPPAPNTYSTTVLPAAPKGGRRLSCPAGQYSDQANQAQCKSCSQGRALIPCTPTSVAGSDKSEQGSITGVYQDVVDVTCNTGLVKTGANPTCQADGMFTAVSCVEPAKCGSLTCPYGYSSKAGATSTDCVGLTCSASNDRDTCCSRRVCNPTSVAGSDKSEKDSITGVYEDVVALTCNNGLVKSGSNPTCQADGMFTAVSCVEPGKCETLTCPYGYTSKAGAASTDCVGITCSASNDRDTCCNPLPKAKCNTMTCPTNYAPKPGSSSLNCGSHICGNSDRNTCCGLKAICDASACGSGFVLKENQYNTEAINPSFLPKCSGTSCTVAFDQNTCCYNTAEYRIKTSGSCSGDWEYITSQYSCRSAVNAVKFGNVQTSQIRSYGQIKGCQLGFDEDSSTISTNVKTSGSFSCGLTFGSITYKCICKAKVAPPPANFIVKTSGTCSFGARITTKSQCSQAAAELGYKQPFGSPLSPTAVDDGDCAKFSELQNCYVAGAYPTGCYFIDYDYDNKGSFDPPKRYPNSMSGAGVAQKLFFDNANTDSRSTSTSNTGDCSTSSICLCRNTRRRQRQRQLNEDNYCVSCPAGKRSDGSQCVFCALGMYSDQIQNSACKDDCSAGSYIKSDKTACVMCDIGQFSHQSNQLTCNMCAAGLSTYNQSGKTSCQENCSAGSHIDINEYACARCVIGQFSDQSNQFTCKSCAAGMNRISMYNDEVGRTSCKDDCGSGSYITADNTACNVCTNVTGATCTDCTADRCTSLTCLANKFDTDKVASNGCEDSCAEVPGGTCTACNTPLRYLKSFWPESGCTAVTCDTGMYNNDQDASNGCEDDSDISSSVVFVKHTIKLDGISATEFNKNIKIVTAFVETVADSIGVNRYEVKKTRACGVDSTEESCPWEFQTGGRRTLFRSLQDDEVSCIVRYEIYTESKEAALVVVDSISYQVRIQSKFKSKFKQSMQEENVETSTSLVIVATLSAEITQVDSSGKTDVVNVNIDDSNACQRSGCNERDLGDGFCDNDCYSASCNYDNGDCWENDYLPLIFIAVGVLCFCITACSCSFVYYKHRKQGTTQEIPRVTEMTSITNPSQGNINCDVQAAEEEEEEDDGEGEEGNNTTAAGDAILAMMIAGQGAPPESRGKKNWGKLRGRIRATNAFKQVKKSSPPPPPLPLEVDDVEVLMDETTGRRYSYSAATGETEWLPVSDNNEPTTTVVEELTTEVASFPEQLGSKSATTQNIEIHTDTTTGKRYSYDQTTGATEWIVAAVETDSIPSTDSSASETVASTAQNIEIHTDTTTGKRYSYDRTTGDTEWLVAAVAETDSSPSTDSSAPETVASVSASASRTRRNSRRLSAVMKSRRHSTSVQIVTAVETSAESSVI